MLKIISNFLLDLIFPKFCVSCNKMGTFLCKSCFQKVKPYSNPIELDLEKNYLDGAFAAAYYDEPISTLIHELKYKSVKDVGITCARMMQYLCKIPEADLITCVPLHKKRQQERGFNQAKVIAKELSRLTQIPYRDLLTRTKHSKPQANVASREERLSRMQNMFSPLQPACRRGRKWRGTPANAGELRLNSVILIDDVTTTLTTLNECAKVLKANGVKKVIGLVVAHGD